MKVLGTGPTVPDLADLAVLDSGLSAQIAAAADEIAVLDRILLFSGAMLPTITTLGSELKALSTGMIAAEFLGLPSTPAVPEWLEEPPANFDAARRLRTRAEAFKQHAPSTVQGVRAWTQAKSISNLDRIPQPHTEALSPVPSWVAKPIDGDNTPVQTVPGVASQASTLASQYVSPTPVDAAPTQLPPVAPFTPMETQSYERSSARSLYAGNTPTVPAFATVVPLFERSVMQPSHSPATEPSAPPHRVAKLSMLSEFPMLSPELAAAQTGRGRPARSSKHNSTAAMEDAPEYASVPGGPADTTEDAREPQQGTILIDGTELGRWVIDHIADQAMRPYGGTTGIDPRVIASFPGAPTGG